VGGFGPIFHRLKIRSNGKPVLSEDAISESLNKWHSHASTQVKLVKMGGADCAPCPQDYLPASRGGSVQRPICCYSRADNQAISLTRLSAAEEIQAVRLERWGEYDPFRDGELCQR